MRVSERGREVGGGVSGCGRMGQSHIGYAKQRRVVVSTQTAPRSDLVVAAASGGGAAAMSEQGTRMMCRVSGAQRRLHALISAC